MGLCVSMPETQAPTERVQAPPVILDQYKSLPEVTQALRDAGLESSNLIVGVDFTRSNEWTGKEVFGGKSMHAVDPEGYVKTPYEEVLSIIGRTLATFDDDNRIPAFAFGDVTTTNLHVMPFIEGGRSCVGMDEVLTQYRHLASSLRLSGPTSFVPLIQAAVNIVRSTRQYHILIIVADGLVDDVEANAAAIVEASSYPLSIVMVGVGCGPWHTMKEFDDRLVGRRFDNFQFVNYHDTMTRYSGLEAAFALGALMEIPEQVKAIKKLGLLNAMP